jgi:hypothetical protein
VSIGVYCLGMRHISQIPNRGAYSDEKISPYFDTFTPKPAGRRVNMHVHRITVRPAIDCGVIQNAIEQSPPVPGPKTDTPKSE